MGILACNVLATLCAELTMPPAQIFKAALPSNGVEGAAERSMKPAVGEVVTGEDGIDDEDEDATAMTTRASVDDVNESQPLLRGVRPRKSQPQQTLGPIQ